MKNMRDFIGQPMEWIQPNAADRSYDLRARTDVVATLRWPKAGGSLALGESADGNWSFKRTGFISTKVTVRATGTESNIAVYSPNWLAGKGTLELAGGGRYLWTIMDFGGSQWAFCNESGEPLVHYKVEWRLQKATAAVEIAPAGAAVSELSLLTMLGWYFIVLAAEDQIGLLPGLIASGTAG